MQDGPAGNRRPCCFQAIVAAAATRSPSRRVSVPRSNAIGTAGAPIGAGCRRVRGGAETVSDTGSWVAVSDTGSGSRCLTPDLGSRCLTPGRGSRCLTPMRRGRRFSASPASRPRCPGPTPRRPRADRTRRARIRAIHTCVRSKSRRTGHGTTAITSISRSRSGRASLTTCTSVLAGGVMLAKYFVRTSRIACTCDMSVV